jgi:hypothetical protein
MKMPNTREETMQSKGIEEKEERKLSGKVRKKGSQCNDMPRS